MARGELSLSTNAIITIVIAAIALILLLTFITTGFGGASKMFFSATDDATQSAGARSGADVLNAATLDSIEPGSDFTLSASFTNPRGAVSDVKLVLSCPDGVLAGPLENTPRSLAARETVRILAIGRAAVTATAGKHLCSLAATPQGQAPLATIDFVLTIE